MDIFNIVRYGHGIFFAALQTMLMFGFILEWRRDRKAAALSENNHRGTAQNKAKVSVIIPIHNEEERMEGLLRTLITQTYPAQIIFVDDRSTDKSPAMLAQFENEARGRGIDCRIITLKENPGPNRKQFALSRGISESDGDYLLFTDGDCEVPSGWVEAMAGRIQIEGIGAVIGPVFKKKHGKGFFRLYQCYDHAVRYNYLAGAIGLGAAGGGFGNNLIISRKALDAAGGYDAIPPSPTEDAALISQIRSMGKYRVCAAAHPDAAVDTAREKSWRSFISQTLRWNNGGIYSPEILTRFNYNLLMLVISTGILAVPLLPFFPELWPMPAGVLFVMIENTIAVFALFRKKMPESASGKKGGIKIIFGYLLALLFMPCYLTLMTLMGYAHIKTKWKEQ